jgi:iron complex transport system substrate-binding protein
MSWEDRVQLLNVDRCPSRSDLQRLGTRVMAVLFLLACPAAASDISGITSFTSTKPRIVSLAPSVTETLFALGAEKHLVGVTSFCDYPAAAKRLPQVGTFMNPSIESLLALKPDLVVAVPERADQERFDRLTALGLKVALARAATINDIFSSVRNLARLVGKEKQGESLVAKIQHQFEAVSAKLTRSPRPRVLIAVGSRPLIAVGSGTYIAELIALAGAANIAATTARAWPSLSPEFVIAAAPEIIIEAGMGSEQGQKGQSWSDLPSIPAVETRRVYRLRSDKLLRPGPRIGEALEELARLIHPECFSASASNGGRCAGP